MNYLKSILASARRARGADAAKFWTLNILLGAIRSSFMKALLLSAITALVLFSVTFAADTQPEFSFRWQDLESVRLIPYPENQVGIELNLKLERAYELFKFTEANKGKKVTILFGDTVFSHPAIGDKFYKMTLTAPNLDEAITLIRQLQPKTAK